MSGASPNTVLVTGGSGFVGGHLLRMLAGLDDPPGRVVVMDVRPPADSAVEFVACDLTDAEPVGAAVERIRPDGIVHLAGIARGADLGAFLRANVLACDHLLAASSRLDPPPRVLVVGTAAQYGIVSGGHEVVAESRPLLGRTPYGLSKTMQERWALLRGREQGVPVVCVRPFNIMGPGQPDSLVPAAFLRQVADVRAGRAEFVEVGNLDTSRDFLDVRDVCAAMWALMTAEESRVAGSVFNIASGEPLAVREVLEFCVALGGGAEVRQDPRRLKASDVPVIVGDASHLRACTGWRPRFGWRESVESMWRDLSGAAADA